MTPKGCGGHSEEPSCNTSSGSLSHRRFIAAARAFRGGYSASLSAPVASVDLAPQSIRSATRADPRNRNHATPSTSATVSPLRRCHRVGWGPPRRRRHFECRVRRCSTASGVANSTPCTSTVDADAGSPSNCPHHHRNSSADDGLTWGPPLSHKVKRHHDGGCSSHSEGRPSTVTRENSSSTGPNE